MLSALAGMEHHTLQAGLEIATVSMRLTFSLWPLKILV